MQWVTPQAEQTWHLQETWLGDTRLEVCLVDCTVGRFLRNSVSFFLEVSLVDRYMETLRYSTVHSFHLVCMIARMLMSLKLCVHSTLVQ